MEVEIRGKIETKKFNWLKNFLHKNGKLIKRKKQLAFYYYLPSGAELRIHCDKHQTVISVKLRKHNYSISREIEIEIDIEEVQDVLDLLKVLGLKRPLVLFKKQWIYKYGKYEFALEDLEGWGPTYEIEVVCKKSQSKEKEKELINLAKKLKLHITDKKEVMQLIEDYKKRYNPIALNKIEEYLSQVKRSRPG